MDTDIIGMAVAVKASPAAIDAVESRAVRDVLRKRVEQIDRHGYTLAHDIDLGAIDLAVAAFTFAGIALDSFGRPAPRCIPASWPLRDGVKPGPDSRANLVEAGAMILAAIDCIDASAVPAKAAEAQDL